MSITKQVSLHGKRAYVSKDNQVGARNGFVAGGVGKPAIVLPGSPDTVAIFDDFLGDTGRALRGNTDRLWRVLDGDTGNDTGSNVTLVPGTSGIMRIAISSTNSHAGPTIAVTNGMGINQSLSWKGNQAAYPRVHNGLRFGCRIKSSGHDDTGRRMNMFAGFTDSIALEAPVYDTGGALQATANDAVGFWYSPGADTGWSALAVKGGGTPTSVALDATRKSSNSNTYDVLELELTHADTGYAQVRFYINGQSKGEIDSPIAMNVALTPIIYAWQSDTGGGGLVDVDWINVSAPRDSGL